MYLKIQGVLWLSRKDFSSSPTCLISFVKDYEITDNRNSEDTQAICILTLFWSQQKINKNGKHMPTRLKNIVKTALVFNVEWLLFNKRCCSNLGWLWYQIRFSWNRLVFAKIRNCFSYVPIVFVTMHYLISHAKVAIDMHNLIIRAYEWVNFRCIGLHKFSLLNVCVMVMVQNTGVNT